MITLSESLMTLAAAARTLPGRTGRGLHAATVWRWSLRGVRGVCLETVMIGGIRYTSREALERFIAATTSAAKGATPIFRTSAQRLRAIEAAERELASI